MSYISRISSACGRCIPIKSRHTRLTGTTTPLVFFSRASPPGNLSISAATCFHPRKLKYPTQKSARSTPTFDKIACNPSSKFVSMLSNILDIASPQNRLWISATLIRRHKKACLVRDISQEARLRARSEIPRTGTQNRYTVRHRYNTPMVYRPAQPHSSLPI